MTKYLIEKSGRQPIWWTRHPYCGRDWVTDTAFATRFDSREAAQQALDGIANDPWWRTAAVTEHQFGET